MIKEARKNASGISPKSVRDRLPKKMLAYPDSGKRVAEVLSVTLPEGIKPRLKSRCGS